MKCVRAVLLGDALESFLDAVFVPIMMSTSKSKKVKDIISNEKIWNLCC